MQNEFLSDPDVALALAELDRRKKIITTPPYQPYPKQLQFHNASNYKERMFFAANQSGKTLAAAEETTYHATGLYPDWWKGKRFPSAIKGWIGSQSYAAQRQAAQSKLLGTDTPISTPDAIGGGTIPRELIYKMTPTRGVADSIDSIIVKHKSGLLSTLTFKTYDQEMAKWAGGTINLVWMDEEPPLAMYIEALMRMSATRGIIYTTFTPLSGRTPLVERFYTESSPDRMAITMTAYEVGHKTKEQVDAELANLPEWEREARIFGRPAAGEGRIILVPESRYVLPSTLELAPYWPRIIGLDIGTLHPTAAVWLAHDLDRNRLIAYDEYRLPSLKVHEHAGSLLLRGAGELPVAWPQDALKRDQGSLEPVVLQYKKLGLNMLSTHAHTPETGNSLWASVTDLVSRLNAAQLVILPHLNLLREELLSYHQDKGKIVDKNDDLISALRYAVMMHKKAKVPDGLSPSERAYRKGHTQVARDMDLDPFAR